MPKLGFGWGSKSSYYKLDSKSNHDILKSFKVATNGTSQ